MAQHQYDVPRLAKRETDVKKNATQQRSVAGGCVPQQTRLSMCHTVQELRREYWQQVKDIDPENLVFF